MRILILATIVLAIALPSLAVDKIPEMTSVEGKHIIFKARVEDMKLLKDPKTWVANLDKMYEGYADLVGDVPFNGEKTTILATEEYPGGWAVAGNPILWYRPCFLESIDIINKGDWLFGIMHEIGHNFDLDYRWVWNAELLANFKMDYALDYAKANVLFGDKFCDYSDPLGCRVPENYRSIATDQGMAERLTDGGQEGDSEHDKFLRIVADIGWEPFKRVFRRFNAMDISKIPNDGLGRRSLFIQMLDEETPEELMPRFINLGFTITDTKDKDVKSLAAALCAKDWNEFPENYLYNVAPGEAVTVRVVLTEQKEKIFKKGLGSHARSEIVYNLDGKYKTFESYIGVTGKDNARNCTGSVVFEVVLDGKSVYKSPILRGGGTYYRIEFDVSGVKELKLLASESSDGGYSDHAGWGDAKVIDANGQVSYLSDMKPEKATQSYGELQLDRDTGGDTFLYGSGGLTREAKIVGMVDGRIVTLNPDKEPGVYSYTFNGLDLGTHLMWLTANVSDSPITQHDLVTIIVK